MFVRELEWSGNQGIRGSCCLPTRCSFSQQPRIKCHPKAESGQARNKSLHYQNIDFHTIYKITASENMHTSNSPKTSEHQHAKQKNKNDVLSLKSCCFSKMDPNPKIKLLPRRLTVILSDPPLPKISILTVALANQARRLIYYTVLSLHKD